MDASSYVAQVHIVIHVTKYNSLIYDVHMLTMYVAQCM